MFPHPSIEGHPTCCVWVLMYTQFIDALHISITLAGGVYSEPRVSVSSYHCVGFIFEKTQPGPRISEIEVEPRKQQSLSVQLYISNTAGESHTLQEITEDYIGITVYVSIYVHRCYTRMV